MVTVTAIGSIRGTHRIGHFHVSGVFVPCIERRLVFRSAPRFWVALQFQPSTRGDGSPRHRGSFAGWLPRFARVRAPHGWRRVASQLRREWWTR